MNRRKEKAVGKARWVASQEGKVIADDVTLDGVFEILETRRGKAVFNAKLTPLRKAVARVLDEAFSACRDEEDGFFFIQVVYGLVVDRYGVNGSQEIFASLGSPTYAKDTRRNLIVAMFEASGLSKAEFARKLAESKYTPSGEANEMGARRYLDRMLKAVARERKKHSLGHSPKKLS